MNNPGENTAGREKRNFWNFIDNIEGDKVVWIIVFMLLMASALAIFSSTSTLTDDGRSRVDLFRTHSFFIAAGLGLIWILYKIKSIRFFRRISQLGFIASLGLLVILDFNINLGFLKADTINDATRSLKLFNSIQIHVFEFVKVAMVMYLAWALDAYRTDQKSIKEGEDSPTFRLFYKLVSARNVLLYPYRAKLAAADKLKRVFLFLFT